MNAPSEMESSDTQAGSGGEADQYVLYPVFESHDHETFEIARDIAEGIGATLLVLDLYHDEGEAIDESRRVARELLDNRLDEDHDLYIETRYEHTDDPVDEVITVARSHATRLIVFDEHTPSSLVAPVAGSVTDRISNRVPCDVVTVERIGDAPIASVLVPIAGGPHTTLAVAVAGAVARSVDAVVELFHVVESGETSDEVDALFATATAQLPEGVTVETLRTDGADVADAIVEQSNHYDLTVVGEPTKGRLRRHVFGSVTDSVSDASHNTVLVARRSDGERFEL